MMRFMTSPQKGKQRKTLIRRQIAQGTRAPKPQYTKKSAALIKTAVFVKGIIGSDTILGRPEVQIAFVGRSNVGKSSTINAILGVAGLARASGTPGKTQEINFFLVNSNTFFVDLPGYGYARLPQKIADSIRKHILWYLTSGEAHPTLLMLILDVRVGVTDHDRELMGVAYEQGHPILVILNKVDKLNMTERTKTLAKFQQEFPTIEFVPFSAKTKEGVDAIRERVFGKLRS